MDSILDLKTATVGSSFYLNETKITEDVNVDLGEIAYMTATVFALGEAEVPVRGLFQDFNYTVNWKHITDQIIDASAVPDVHKHKFCFNEDIIDYKTSKHRIRNVVIKLEGEPKTLVPAESVNMGERNDVPSVFTGYMYYRYHDGKPVIEFDRRKGVFRVNGKDMYQDIRRGL